MSFFEAEEACIGIDHAALGGIIARHWNFSSHLVFMLKNHHLADPEARRDAATAAIYLSDMVSMMAGTCIGVDRLAYPVYEDLFSNFFLSREELESLMLAYEGHIRAAERLFEVPELKQSRPARPSMVHGHNNLSMDRCDIVQSVRADASGMIPERSCASNCDLFT
jgi:hypothetical protein